MKRLLIWGTGGQAEKIQKLFPKASHKIVAYVDSYRNGEFHGLPIITPESAAQLVWGKDFDQLAIASTFYPEIHRQAVALGIPTKAILPASFWHFLNHADQLTDTQFSDLIAVPLWFYSFEILPGVITPGYFGTRPELTELLNAEIGDLTGLRALDIGAMDGAHSLELAQRGAEVTAFDIQPPTHTGFATMRKLHDLPLSHFCASVYDLSPGVHGTYDLVLFLGVYYHLKNPLAALANINAVLPTGGLMLLEGAVLEGAPKLDPAWAGRTEFVAAMKDTPLACYIKGDFARDWSNWWVPNITCLRDWVESSGFEIVRSTTLEGTTRAFMVARKVRETPLEHGVMPAF